MTAASVNSPAGRVKVCKEGIFDRVASAKVPTLGIGATGLREPTGARRLYFVQALDRAPTLENDGIE